MKLKERILRIKELLRYCSNESVDLVDEKLGIYFKKFFDDSRFRHHPDFDHCYPEIGLYLAYNSKDNPTLFIEYEYNWDREGCDSELLLFNDDEAKYEVGDWGNRNASDSMYKGSLEYSDIEGWVWEKIEQYILLKAGETIKKNLAAAEDHYEHCLKQYEKFYG